MAKDFTNSDEYFHEWMLANLAHGAAELQVEVVGEPVTGWRDRSVGSRVMGRDGERLWLRVVSDFPEYTGEWWWRGNSDATQQLPGWIRRPEVLGLAEWHEPGFRTQRAELMSFLDGDRVSIDGSGDGIVSPLELRDGWWSSLHTALEGIRSTSTERVVVDQAKVGARLEPYLGTEGRPAVVRHWEVLHGDLHWGNMLDAPFGLLDWEFWGIGPACLDEAVLYCHSLGHSRVAELVREQVGERLDSEDGRVALLYAAQRLLRRVHLGDFPELATPLDELVASLRD